MQVPSKEDNDVLSLMRHRLDQTIGATTETRNDELDDLKFYAGSPDNRWQWPSDVLATRGAVQGETINARPTLTINKLPQHVKQITNDQRQNRPSGRVIPVDDKADVEIATIYEGVVRHIEYISDADIAYDTACENQVVFGEGYWRIITKYCDDDSFNQDILIQRIINSFSVYMDPMIQLPCGEDAEFCIISEKQTHDEYKRNFPKASPVSSLLTMGTGDSQYSQWVSDDTVTIAEYFYVTYEEYTLNLYENGEIIKDSPEKSELAKALYGEPIKTRTGHKRVVNWIKTNGYEVLERNIWPGEVIPVIRVVGNEFFVDGRRYISGIVRNAKDAQRMYNYWTSQQAEMLALAPKAPFIAAVGQIDGLETQWKLANVNNYPVLQYNPIVNEQTGHFLPPPQRVAPPLQQGGLVEAKMGASDDIKSTTGQYDSSLGATSNERSGKAILARERQVDVGTYHYVDNLARAVRASTRQIVYLIPIIYDVKRIARIIGEDGEPDTVQLDPNASQPVNKIEDENGNTIKKIYNLGIGKYDVCVTTGPSYMTKRQEALEGMAQLLQGNPNLWAVAGDLFVKNMDWPGAQEMAKRFARTIPPNILGTDDETPEMAALKQEMQQTQQQLQATQQMLMNVSHSVEVQDSVRKDYEAKIKAYDAETKRFAQLYPVLSQLQIDQIANVSAMGISQTSQSMSESEGDLQDPTRNMQQSQEPQMPSPTQPTQPQLQQLQMPQQ